LFQILLYYNKIVITIKNIAFFLFFAYSKIMKKEIPITVAMLVCNREEYLKESLNSILRQTYQNFEFLIIDDCSQDGSFAILQEYQKKDNRIQVFQNKKNQGEAYNRNFLVKKARGKYLAWMDDDDLCPDYRLYEQWSYLEQHSSIDIVGGQTIYFGDQKKFSYAPLSDHSIKSHLLSISSFANPSTMLRLEKIKKYNFQYPLEFLLSPDFAFLVNACPKLNFANLPRIFYYYRCHKKQLTGKSEENERTYLKVIKNHLARFGIQAEDRTIATFFPLLEPVKNLGELQKLTGLVTEVLKIKKFYGYQGIHREMKYKLSSAMYYQYYRFYKKCGVRKLLYFTLRHGLPALFFVFLVKFFKSMIILKTYQNQWRG
jgi:glycosyltransferase involved in cell wall biosynthesis